MFRYDIKLVTKRNGIIVGKTTINNTKIMTKTEICYDFENEPYYVTVVYKFYKGRYIGVRCEYDDNSIESSVRYTIDNAIMYNEI